MVLHQLVEDDVRAGASVVDVADDVQVLNREALDQLGEGDDEGLCAAGRHDGIDLALVVGRLVFDAFLVVEQFFDGFGDTRRQQLAYGVAPVLGAQAAGELGEAHQG